MSDANKEDVEEECHSITSRPQGLNEMQVQSSVQHQPGRQQLSELSSTFIAHDTPTTTDSWTSTAVTKLNQEEEEMQQQKYNVTWTFESIKPSLRALQQNHHLDSQVGYHSGHWTHHVNLAKR